MQKIILVLGTTGRLRRLASLGSYISATVIVRWTVRNKCSVLPILLSDLHLLTDAKRAVFLTAGLMKSHAIGD